MDLCNLFFALVLKRRHRRIRRSNAKPAACAIPCSEIKASSSNNHAGIITTKTNCGMTGMKLHVVKARFFSTRSLLSASNAEGVLHAMGTLLVRRTTAHVLFRHPRCFQFQPSVSSCKHGLYDPSLFLSLRLGRCLLHGLRGLLEDVCAWPAWTGKEDQSLRLSGRVSPEEGL